MWFRDMYSVLAVSIYVVLSSLDDNMFLAWDNMCGLERRPDDDDAGAWMMALLMFMFADERERKLQRMGGHRCTSLFLRQALLELASVSSSALPSLSRYNAILGIQRPSIIQNLSVPE